MVSDIAELAGYEAAWRDLAIANANPFVTPEWAKAMAEPGGIRAVVVTRGGELIGIMPLTPGHYRGFPVLNFPGSRLGDRFHPVAASTDRAEVATHAVETVARSRQPALHLEKCDDEGGWIAASSGTAVGGLRAVELFRQELPEIEIQGLDWDGYLASKSRDFRQKIRRAERKLVREHQMRVRVCTEAATLEADFATLFELHDLRREVAGPSSLASPEARRRLLDFCRHSLEQGWLRLRIMECDERPVAAFLGWSLGGRYCFYQSGFDPAWGRRSVGFLSLALAVREAIDEGAEVFDLLLGTESYKLRFASRSRSVTSVVVSRRLGAAGLLGKVEASARELRTRLRRR